jgi:ABC-2 type transport system permease protein
VRSSLALARREMIRFFRQPSRIVGAVAPPVLMWVLVASGFRSSLRAGGDGGSFGYFFPGTVVLVVLFASIFSTISVIEDRREGFLQAVLVSPVGPGPIVLGKVLGGTFLGLLQGGILLALVPALGLRTDAAALAAALGLLLVVSFALTSLGFAIAWSLESTQGFHAIMNLFLIPMWLLSGAFFPLEGAPAWLRAVMVVNPLTYGVAALRRALGGNAGELPSMTTSIAVTLAAAAILFAAAAAVVVKNPTGPERRRLRPATKGGKA